jgi:imidazolonepropionase
MREISLIADGCVAISGETIVAVGATDDVMRGAGRNADCEVVDATGRVVTPGLVDPHTHPVFAGNRAAEFEMRIEGKTYEEIAAAGGGIRSTVRKTRAATDEELARTAAKRFDRMLLFGTTTAEAKSGYGLSTGDELRQLEVIRKLNRQHHLELVPTFLGAHEVPDEFRQDRGAYIDLLTHEMIPAVAEKKLAEFSDVFCDRGVYSNDETRQIQDAAARHGMKLKLHADELASTGGAELAAEMGAVSADHLIRVSDAGLSALRTAGTIAVLLPGTSFSLGATKFAPGRRMLDEGVAVALATDCNAGSCNTESLQIAAALAAQHYRFTAAECWHAITCNAAWALCRADRIGSLVPGHQADIAIWDMEDYRELPFHFGVNLLHMSIKKGRIVVSNSQIRGHA